MKVVLLTNAGERRGKRFGEKLTVDYFARAKKPRTGHFQKIQDAYGLEKSEMAHVGNSMRDDIAGGNSFGITTCLIRRYGKATKVPNVILTIAGISHTHEITDELQSRGIWRKHHRKEDGDQYYQIGEIPRYLEIAE